MGLLVVVRVVGFGGAAIGRGGGGGGGGVGEPPNLYEGALEGSNLVGSEVVGCFAIWAEIEGLILTNLRVRVSRGRCCRGGGGLGLGCGIIWWRRRRR